MKIEAFSSNLATLQELGKRLKAQRIAGNVTREALARKSGVSLSTIARMEAGQSVAIDGWLSVLRGLNLLVNVDMLVPEMQISPIDAMEYGHIRQRASKRKETKESNWKWGDEE